MIYDAASIVNVAGRLHYDLVIPDRIYSLSGYNQKDVELVILSLRLSLPELRDVQLSVDSETLLDLAWCNGKNASHNRVLGSILRSLVKHEVVPLIRLPKGGGSRIRFQVRRN